MRIPVNVGGVVKWIDPPVAKVETRQLLLREAYGHVLREIRNNSGKTLREISTSAQVALGYVSEVERGHKEPSSEILSSICGALDISLSELLFRASVKLQEAEGSVIPDIIPDEMVTGVLAPTGKQ